MVGGDEDARARPVRETGGQTRARALKNWFLIYGNRLVIAAVLSLSLFVGSLLVWRFGPVPQEAVLHGRISSAGFSNGFSSLQETTGSVLVIVLAINQLVLSPELGSLEALRDRLDDVIDYRTEVERAGERRVAPTSPSAFLRLLLRATADGAEALRESMAATADGGGGHGNEDGSHRTEDGGGNRDSRTAVDRYVERLRAEAEEVDRKLSGRRFQDVAMYRAAMDFEAMTLSHDLQRAVAAHDGQLTDAQKTACDELRDRLELYAIGREYFTTVYVRAEFVNFSYALLVTGLLAIATAAYGTQLFRPAVFPGSTLGVFNVLWLLSAAYTVVLVPISLLISYIARLVTITKRTLFTGPFIPAGATRQQTTLEDTRR